MFAPEQPDLDWHNPAVEASFEEILRFWLDRGVDGFRIDVAQALFKDQSLADDVRAGTAHLARGLGHGREPAGAACRCIASGASSSASYEGDRMLVGEIVLLDQDAVAEYVAPGRASARLQLHAAPLRLGRGGDAGDDRRDEGGARRRRRAADLGAREPRRRPPADALRRRAEGARRANAAALLLLALPGTVFLYEGQELGLEEVDIPDDLKQDPIFFRTNGERLGRDGCRVPIPWARVAPGFGFTESTPWLPIPDDWAEKSVAAQETDPASVLALYRAALTARRESAALQSGVFTWREAGPGALAFERRAGDDTVACVVNVDADEFALPEGELLLASDPDVGATLSRASAAWVRLRM